MAVDVLVQDTEEYIVGLEAGLCGAPASDNIYELNTKQWDDWERGRIEGYDLGGHGW